MKSYSENVCSLRMCTYIYKRYLSIHCQRNVTNWNQSVTPPPRQGAPSEVVPLHQPKCPDKVQPVLLGGCMVSLLYVFFYVFFMCLVWLLVCNLCGFRLKKGVSYFYLQILWGKPPLDYCKWWILYPRSPHFCEFDFSAKSWPVLNHHLGWCYALEV